MSVDILLIGGGHAHVTALRWLRDHPHPDVSIRLINPGSKAVYSGMVPGFVAGHFHRDEIDIDLAPLCRDSGTQLVEDRICGLDPVARTATTDSGAVHAFGIVSIDIGIVSAPPQASQTSRALPVKPMAGFADVWQGLAGNLPSHITIVGAGLGGVELALAVRHAQRAQLGDLSGSVTLIDRDTPLSSASPALRHALRKHLDRAGIDVRKGVSVSRFLDGHLVLNDGCEIQTGLVLWAAGATAHDWLSASGLETDHGFPLVGPTLESHSHPGVFVAGDAAAMSGMTVPKAGVYAVRQGPVLMQNLLARLKERPLQAFRPQADYLKLVSLGRRAALAEKWGLCVQLPGLWWLKSRIDRAFVQG